MQASTLGGHVGAFVVAWMYSSGWETVSTLDIRGRVQGVKKGRHIGLDGTLNIPERAPWLLAFLTLLPLHFFTPHSRFYTVHTSPLASKNRTMQPIPLQPLLLTLLVTTPATLALPTETQAPTYTLHPPPLDVPPINWPSHNSTSSSNSNLTPKDTSPHSYLTCTNACRGIKRSHVIPAADAFCNDVEGRILDQGDGVYDRWM